MNNSVRRLSINANQPECQTQKNSQGLAAVMNRSRIWHKITVFIFDNRTSTFSEYAQIHQTLSKYIFGSATSSPQISDSLFVCLSLDLPYHLKERRGSGVLYILYAKESAQLIKHILAEGEEIFILFEHRHIYVYANIGKHRWYKQSFVYKNKNELDFLMIHHRALGTISNQVSSSRGLLGGCPWFWKSGTPSGELGCP